SHDLHSFPTRRSSDLAIHFRNELLIVAERGEGLAQGEEVFRTIVAFERFRNRVLAVLDSAMTKTCQCEGISFTSQNCVDNLQARSEEHTSELQSRSDI